MAAEWRTNISPGWPSGTSLVAIVDHTYLDARHRPAEGARADLTRLEVVPQHTHHLCHAPDLDQRKAKAPFEQQVQLRLDAGANAEADVVVPLVLPRRLVEQQGRDHTEIMHNGRARLGNLPPPPLWMEAIRLNLAVACQNGTHQGHNRGVHVIQRQRIVDPVLAGAQTRQASERSIPGAGRDLVSVRQDAALRADPRSSDSGAKSWVGQSSEHDADHCETDKRRSGSRVALEVAGEAPTVADPGERSLDDPAFGKHDEAMQFIALDDRQLPGASLGDGGRGLLPLVPGISEDKLDEGEEAACAPIEDEQSAVAILHGGRVDDDVA